MPHHFFLRVGVVGALLVAVAAAYRDVPRPIAWIHVPKTGTTFVNVLTRAACDPEVWRFAYERGNLRSYLRAHDVGELCPGGFSGGGDGDGDGFPSTVGHVGFAPYRASHVGRGVALFREPRARLASGYLHNYHSYRRRSGEAAPTVGAYAAALAGCAVRMLARGPGTRGRDGRGDRVPERRSEPCGAAPPPTGAEVAAAIATLEELAFVGITDRWNMTVCLWHATFGGDADAAELEVHRPSASVSRVPAEQRAGILRRFANVTDPYDGPLYSAAARLFERRVADLGLAPERCAAEGWS